MTAPTLADRNSIGTAGDTAWRQSHASSALLLGLLLISP
jgi:hypothetical protein